MRHCILNWCTTCAHTRTLDAGIPVYQQRLVYKDAELQDEFCLEEYGIDSGAQLKLLVAMRGGPVHAHRRMSILLMIVMTNLVMCE